MNKFAYSFIACGVNIVAALMLSGCASPSNDLNSRLTSAIENHDLDGLKSAIAAGADTNLKSNDSYSVLHLAVRENNCLAAELLIENGADTNDPAWGSHFPLDGAITNKNLECVKLLLKKGANPNETHVYNSMFISPFSNALTKEKYDPAIVEELLKFGGDCKFKLRDDGDGTVLEDTIRDENTMALEQLLQNGCNPNFYGQAGWTPLMHAVVFENLEAVMILLKYGADPLAKTKNGDSVLDYTVAVDRNDLKLAIKSEINKVKIGEQSNPE